MLTQFIPGDARCLILGFIFYFFVEFLFSS